jgi:hypothetical protein
MTLGVAGIGFEEFRDIVNGGRSGCLITPVKYPTISGTLRSQKLEEWRCLSFREARVVKGKEWKKAIESSEEKCADSAA